MCKWCLFRKLRSCFNKCKDWFECASSNESDCELNLEPPSSPKKKVLDFLVGSGEESNSCIVCKKTDQNLYHYDQQKKSSPVKSDTWNESWPSE